MSAFGSPVFKSPNKSYWLSEVPSELLPSTIATDTIDANFGNFSTLFADDMTVSTARFSTFGVQNLDVSGMYVSSIAANSGFFSTLFMASDLSGGLGYVRFTTDASGIQVDGDPIRFDNLVYLTSTINIIQVSTLVDTDIFAQRGFFSTLSTGNFSANQSYFNQTYISSLEVGDLSGYSPATWSKFPTLSGEIIMSTGYNLSNVGATLYFAGQQLATPADISGIDSWSEHPAISTLYMDNNNIAQISSLLFQDGASLTSKTGNNLFYNGQAVQYGATSNVSQWANYPAVTTINTNNFGINTSGNLPITATSNIRIQGSIVSTVADQGAAIASFADVNLTAQNGNKGRINLTANPGFQGLFGEVNVTANGGTVAGVGTGGLVTITANTPFGTLCNATSAIKLSASGINSYAGAIPSVGSLAGYNFIYGTAGVNICTGLPAALPNIPGTTYLYGINGVTTSSDFYTPTIQPYWNGITNPPDLIISGRYIVPNLYQVYLQLSNVKYMYMGGAAQILGANLVQSVSTVANVGVFSNSLTTNTLTTNTILNNLQVSVSSVIGNAAINNILIPDNITGVTNAPNPLQARVENFSSIQSGTMSTTNLVVSTINGLPWDISGATPESDIFSTLYTSSIQASTLIGRGFEPSKVTMIEGNGLIFKNPSLAFPQKFISSVEYYQSPGENMNIYASTVNITANQGGSNGYVRIGEGSAFDSFFTSVNSIPSLSSQQIISKSTITENITVSTLGAFGGTPIKVSNLIEFITPSGIDNVDIINLNSDAIPELIIQASTINIAANNTRIGSLSTTRQTVSSLAFSTATSVGSNTNFNYPIFLDYDTAGNTTTAGVAIAVQGHNLAAGAVRNQIEFGTRANGENYIAALWPGQNLEDLYIDATETIFRDGTFSTIVNLDPYGLITNGAISAPSLLVSSINGNNAQVAYANILQLSSMQLAQSNSTICWWDSISPNSFVNASGYDIVIGQNGTYKIGASRQYNNTSGSDVVEYYFMKNGQPIEYTNSKTQIVNNSELIAYSEIVDTFVNGDSIQLGQYTTSADIYLSTFPGAYCSSPAVICTIYKVD